MSEVRQQGLIGAPPDVVREVIVDVERHHEWWPGAVEEKAAVRSEAR